MKKALWFLLFIFLFTACSEEKNVKKPIVSKAEAKSQSPLKTNQISKENNEKKKETENLKATPIVKPVEKKVEVKNISQSNHSSVKTKKVYQKVFYPFFKDLASIPYSMRVKMDRLCSQIRHLKRKRISVSVLAYASSKEKGKRLKLARLRAENTVAYLSWKSRLPKKYFHLQAKILRTGKEEYKRRVLIRLTVKS